jgi:hypothetical protein
VKALLRIDFQNKSIVIDENEPFPFAGLEVQAIKDAVHGDIKTRLDILRAGECGEIIKIFSNSEGIWCRVIRDNSPNYFDIRPSYLKVLS